jgi:hypothetical protein
LYTQTANSLKAPSPKIPVITQEELRTTLRAVLADEKTRIQGVYQAVITVFLTNPVAQVAQTTPEQREKLAGDRDIANEERSAYIGQLLDSMSALIEMVESSKPGDRLADRPAMRTAKRILADAGC